MGTLNIEERTYTADCGIVIPLLPVSAMMIAAMQSDLTDHPKPPVVEVQLGGQKRLIENADDPAYLERTKQWADDRDMKMIRFMLATGTNLTPDKEWIDRMESFIPNPTPDNLRVYWLMSRLTTEETNDLFEKIMSITMPTEKGIALSSERFPRED